MIAELYTENGDLVTKLELEIEYPPDVIQWKLRYFVLGARPATHMALHPNGFPRSYREGVLHEVLDKKSRRKQPLL